MDRENCVKFSLDDIATSLFYSNEQQKDIKKVKYIFEFVMLAFIFILKAILI